MSDEYPCTSCGSTFTTGQSLGGHRKTHGKHATNLPRPACFTDDEEWQYSIQQLRVEHPEMNRITADFALAEACASCPIEFMEEMESKGRCHPPAGAIPQRDFSDEVLNQ